MTDTQTEQSLAPIRTELTRLDELAITLSIATQEENESATKLLASLKKLGKEVKDRKEKITKPLNAALKSARELFAPLETQLENLEGVVGRKMLDFKKKVEAEAAEKAAKLAARVEKGTMKLETAERKIAELPQTQKTIDTDFGRVQFRKIKKVRVVDESKIPDKYWIIDQVLLRKDALAGVEIAGAEVYEEETV